MHSLTRLARQRSHRSQRFEVSLSRSEPSWSRWRTVKRWRRRWSESWKSMEGIDPPRGFAFAWFKIGNADIGVYSLHLKSNLIMHGDAEVETAKNIRKREVSIQQLLAHIHDVIGTVIPSIKGLVVGGDFNTNHDQ